MRVYRSVIIFHIFVFHNVTATALILHLDFVHLSWYFQIIMFICIPIDYYYFFSTSANGRGPAIIYIRVEPFFHNIYCDLFSIHCHLCRPAIHPSTIAALPFAVVGCPPPASKLYRRATAARPTYIDKYRFSLRREIENATPRISITTPTLLPKYPIYTRAWYIIT